MRQQATSAADTRRHVDLTIHTTFDPEVVITALKYETIVGGQTLYRPCNWATCARGGRVVDARDYYGQSSPCRGEEKYPD